MNLRNAAFAAVGIALLALVSYAQVTTLEGDVKGLDGKGVVGAVIKIHRTDIKWDSSTKTDKHGHYIHAGVPLAGTFDITLEIDGKMVDKVLGVKVSMGDHPPVDFDLRKNGAQAAANRNAEIQKAFETGQISDDLKRQMTPEAKANLEKQIADQADKIKKNKALNDTFTAGYSSLQDAIQATDPQVKGQKYQEAVTSLEKAAELDATQASVWANLGDAYIGLAGTKTGPEFDALAQKGVDAYTKSIAIKPDDAAVHNNYALALAKAKKYPEMQAELKRAAELDPATAYVKFFNLGALMTNNGQAEAAYAAFKMAIDSAPDNPKNCEAYYQYGLSLAAQASVAPDGKITAPPGTVEAFQKYLQLAPDGKNAQSAKDMLTQLGSTIETNYKNPNSNKKKK
jgi:tetratricopeptide (TPR) repeat protein